MDGWWTVESIRYFLPEDPRARINGQVPVFIHGTDTRWRKKKGGSECYLSSVQ